MKKRIMTDLDKVQRILDIIVVGAEPVQDGTAYRFFGLGTESLSISGGEDLLEYDHLVTSLYSTDRDIQQSYSKKSFIGKLIDFIRPKKLKEVSPTKEEVQGFYSELRAAELIEYRVLRELFGIILSDNNRTLSLGNFEIYHFPSHRTEFETTLGAQLQLMTRNREPAYVIEYKVSAREQDRAVEIADNYFRKFVLYLRYIIGTSDRRFEIGILEYQGWNVRNVHVIHGNQYLGGATEGYGSFQPVTLDDPYFVNPEGGFDKLWVRIDKSNLSELEKRICTAVEWVGRSLLSASVQTAFIEASVAIESLFTYSEKAIIIPSILNQISESVALIVGNSAEERIAVEKEIKELYSTRSGIVHAGDKEVAIEEYILFIQYIRIVITKLLTDNALAKCTMVGELHEYLKCQKYS